MSLIGIYKELNYEDDKVLNKLTSNYISGIENNHFKILELLTKENINGYSSYLEERFHHYELHKKALNDSGFKVLDDGDSDKISKLTTMIYMVSEFMNTENINSIVVNSGILLSYFQFKEKRKIEKELEDSTFSKKDNKYIISTENYKIVVNRELNGLLCCKGKEIINISKETEEFLIKFVKYANDYKNFHKDKSELKWNVNREEIEPELKWNLKLEENNEDIKFISKFKKQKR